jgi:hypothetical protein
MKNRRIVTVTPYLIEAVKVELSATINELYFGGGNDSPYVVELKEKQKGLEKALFELTDSIEY